MMQMTNENAVEKMVLGTCDACEQDGLYLDGVLRRFFQENVCFTCKQAQQNEEPEHKPFDCLTKSKAKKQYILPESVFHGLPYMTKPNPRHESFAPLKLYLRKHMVAEALRVHGSLEAIAREKQARDQKAYEKAAKRTRKTLQKRKNPPESDELPPTKSSKSSSSYIPVAAMDHQHSFTKEYYDEEAKSWKKECDTCEMTVAFEKW